MSIQISARGGGGATKLNENRLGNTAYIKINFGHK